MLKKPNLFILGAPKCGTTSLSFWLAQHPNIFMSTPKEPMFFCPDVVKPSPIHNVPSSIEGYEALFDVNESHDIVGEASTHYLYSRVAVNKIKTFNPNSKFIVCLRSPIEMLISLHTQRLKEGVEEEKSLKKAWRLQKDRENGKKLPIALFGNPEPLLYGKICMLGEQVQRLLNTVPRDRVFFVFLEDMNVKPNVVYQKILTFLEVSHFELQCFTTYNKGKIPKFLLLAVLTRFLGQLKLLSGIRFNLGLQTWVNSVNQIPKTHPSINKSDLNEFISFFRDDVILLAKLLDRDLTHWLDIDHYTDM